MCWQREWLWNPCLTLYVTSDEVAQGLRYPHYPLLLGRSQDVAYVASWHEATLEAVDAAPLSGVLLPFPVRDGNLRSRLAAFPLSLLLKHNAVPVPLNHFISLIALRVPKQFMHPTYGVNVQSKAAPKVLWCAVVYIRGFVMTVTPEPMAKSHRHKPCATTLRKFLLRHKRYARHCSNRCVSGW
jgi:hypothetical protein